MQPLTANDDDLLVYCDWLEDNGRSQEAEELREEIINPNVEIWQGEFPSCEHVGSMGSGFNGVGCGGHVDVGNARCDEVGGFGSGYSWEVGGRCGLGLAGGVGGRNY